MALAQVIYPQPKIPNMELPSGVPGEATSALSKSVHITEFSDTRVNPEPVVIEEADILMEKHLSDNKLRLLTGVDNLEDVRNLQLKVDTSETSLGNFGALLPNLTQLRLSNSIIPSIRDLGSSLRNLTVLWMSRCGAEDIDGAASMMNLKELYLSYNEITDISGLSLLDQLQILDLEGNNLDDVSQIQYLELCQKLNSLILEGNPLCTQANPYEVDDEYDYRLIVRRHLPDLKFLDEEELTDTLVPTKKSNVFDADWAYLEELQKDTGLASVDSCDTDEGPSRPSSAAVSQTVNYRPGTAMRPNTGFRPLTASKRPNTVTGIKPGTPQRPVTAMPGRPGTGERPDSREREETDAASQLTTGTVICGNISKALRSRKQVNSSAIKESTDRSMFRESKHRPEHTYDSVIEEEDETNRKELIEELKTWRKEHEVWMVELKESKAPQILVIDHNDADESLSVSSSDDELSDGDSPDYGASDEEDEPIEGSQPKSNHDRRRSLKLDESFDADGEVNFSPTHSVRPKNSAFQPAAPLAPIPRPSPLGIPSHQPIINSDITRSNLPSSTATGLEPRIPSHRQMPIPPAHRPSTARAVLVGSRIRRQLPDVPSVLPSKPKPSIPK